MLRFRYIWSQLCECQVASGVSGSFSTPRTAAPELSGEESGGAVATGKVSSWLGWVAANTAAPAALPEATAFPVLWVAAGSKLSGCKKPTQKWRTNELALPSAGLPAHTHHWKDMLKLKLQHFGHLMPRADSLKKTLMLGEIEGGSRRGWQRMRWLNSITDSMDMNLNKFCSGTECGGVLQSLGLRRVKYNWTTTTTKKGENRGWSKWWTEIRKTAVLGIKVIDSLWEILVEMPSQHQGIRRICHKKELEWWGDPSFPPLREDSRVWGKLGDLEG